MAAARDLIHDDLRQPWGTNHHHQTPFRDVGVEGTHLAKASSSDIAESCEFERQNNQTLMHWKRAQDQRERRVYFRLVMRVAQSLR